MYPILNRWPTKEEMPDKSVWLWHSTGWNTETTIRSPVRMVASGEYMALSDGGVILSDAYIWDDTDFVAGDRLERIG